jgi:hypothetical protein
VPSRDLAIVAALFLMLGGCAQARAFRLPTPDEMDKASTLVCNAVVESITDTGKPDNQGNWTQKRMEAKLKLLHVFKGNASSEITISYRALDLSHDQFVDDGPQDIQLKVGGRYRFFLVPDQVPGVYTDVQWQTSDEEFAAQPLGAQEHDDSPYIGQEEAAKIATDYVQAHAPKILTDLMPGQADCFPVYDNLSSPGNGLGTEYVMDFRIRPEHTDIVRDSARVVIWGDRTVDEKDCALKPAE